MENHNPIYEPPYFGSSAKNLLKKERRKIGSSARKSKASSLGEMLMKIFSPAKEKTRDYFKMD